MKFGIDRLIEDAALRRPLAGKRLALLAHPASVTRDLTHSIDALAACAGLRLSAAFGPQHGLRGDKQYNMLESPDYTDPVHRIPVFSLYGKVRRPTAAMMDSFDVLLVDLQDLGCRVYTFMTTLRYVLEEAARTHKAVWILDRPNPAGRPVEGLSLRPGWESFVGAGSLPMRHGLTLGELARWFVASLRLDVDCRVIEMQGWEPDAAPGYGWPLEARTWVNPSPNAPNPWMARCYSGSVMLEGTNLSEGRGTTRPLELLGAPDLDVRSLLGELQSLAPGWLRGCRLRPCYFEPTFNKHAGQLCAGVQVHVEDPAFYEHQVFRPWRLFALTLKALRRLRPDYDLWADFPYEYEVGKLAIDVINGSELLRCWVDDPAAGPADLDALAARDEADWRSARQALLLY
ncbi:MAG: exo-beta-N-acetylmuramidase NamZ domain-containing protein [Steroidobacteraceae bacterium]